MTLELNDQELEFISWLMGDLYLGEFVKDNADKAPAAFSLITKINAALPPANPNQGA